MHQSCTHRRAINIGSQKFLPQKNSLHSKNMANIYVLIALFACAAVANAGLLPAAAIAPGIVAPYASSFNAHHINHAVALPVAPPAVPVAAPAPFAVAAPPRVAFAAPAFAPKLALAAPAPVAFAAPARIAAPIAAPLAAPLPFAPAPLQYAPAPLRFAAPAPFLG
uniref:Cuticle protein 16.5 n=1 Tax=Bactrocera latifrons TaxID=174628 RepID=A0A0K8UJ52_BACLA